MKLTLKDYLIFEETNQGKLILDDLVTRFGGGVYVQGGQEAARQTDYNCGARAVLDYILDRVDKANNGNGEQDNV